MRNDRNLFIPQAWKQVMELNTKCVVVANTCKMLTSLLTSVKGAIEKDCNKSASSRSIKLITFLNSAVSKVSPGTTAS